WQGQDPDDLGPYTRSGRLFQVATGRGMRWGYLAPQLREGRRRACRLPGAPWVEPGAACAVLLYPVRRRTLRSTEAVDPAPAPVIGRLLSRLFLWRKCLMVLVCCPSPDPGTHWHMGMCSLS